MPILDPSIDLEQPSRFTIEEIVNLMPLHYRKNPEFKNNIAGILRKYNFLNTPAYTHNYSGDSNRIFEGGLAAHSVQVYKLLKQYTELGIVKWDRSISPFLVGILHDICKAYLYRKNNVGVWEHRPDAVFTGHGDLSLIILSLEEFALTTQEALCIRWHMGAYEKDHWKEYDQAVRQCPAILAVNMADMMAAKVMNK